jgi:c-di-AMP phosphodiesterase-like protein
LEKKLSRIISPRMAFYYAVLIVFTAAGYYFAGWYVGAAQTAVTLFVLLFYLLRDRRRRREINKLIELMTLNSDISLGTSITDIPVPMVLLRVSSGEIVWCNDSFRALTAVPKNYYGTEISALVSGFDLKWVLDGKERRPEMTRIGERWFNVSAGIVHPAKEDYASLFAMLYWLESTTEVELRAAADDARHVIAEIMCDNYDDIMKSASETEKAALVAALNNVVLEWTSGIEGLLRRTDRDKYLFVFNEKGYKKLAAERFRILEMTKKITSPNGVNMTVSVGIGRDGENFDELSRFSSLALEMALSRGGDQAVVKNRLNFEFFGGMSREVEKRTRVKTRLTANALKSLILESSRVYVMGHRFADLDSLGGAVGIVCAARALGKEARIVINRDFTNAQTMIELIETNPKYKGVLISPTDAMIEMDAKSLLVVVDTNRASYTEDQSLLESFNRVVVIDHHRRVADYIQNATLTVHEVSASSVCELIAELLEFIVGRGEMLGLEASAMLAGIVLDTKGFTLKTGSRTFEAAAYLRREGADSITVKKLFQNDLENYTRRAELVKNVEFVEGKYAIVCSEEPIDRALASQTADDLMNIAGVSGSFVIFPFEDTIAVSARSMGRINVQLIMETLGGGGHFTAAGAQLRDTTIEEVKSRLLDAITLYSYRAGV